MTANKIYQLEAQKRRTLDERFAEITGGLRVSESQLCLQCGMSEDGRLRYIAALKKVFQRLYVTTEEVARHIDRNLQNSEARERFALWMSYGGEQSLDGTVMDCCINHHDIVKATISLLSSRTPTGWAKTKNANVGSGWRVRRPIYF